MYTVAILNLKGGVGKTTTAVNLAAGLCHAGYRTLLADLDTQGSAGEHLGVDSEGISAADVLTGKAAISQAAARTHEADGGVLDVLRSGGKSLSEARVYLASRHSKKRLSKALRAEDSYDFCIVDAAPGLDMLWLNALYAADLVICPVELQMAAVVGLKGFLDIIADVAEEDDLHVPILYLPTNEDGRVGESRSIREVLVERFGDYPQGTVLPSIRYSSALSKAVGERRSIFEHNPSDRGAIDYAALTNIVTHYERGHQPKNS